MDRLSENLCLTLLKRAAIGVIITDRKFYIRMMNQTAGKLFAVDPQKMRDQPVDMLMPEYRREITRKLLARSAKLIRSVEVRIQYSAGKKKRDLAIVVDPVTSEAGKPTAMCLWVRDQTRRMQMERRLAQIEKLASLGQLAGGLAHHFNNILGGVVTAADHGLTCDDVPGTKRALQLVSDGATKAVELTRKLLEFSAPELPEQNLVDLTEAVISFAERVEERLRQSDRRLDVEIKSVPILAVPQAKIQQILNSLLANSEQALGKRGGKIRITLETDNDQVRILFQDDGPGIPPEIAEQMFEPFFTTRGPIGGGSEANLGLGLTLAYRLATEIGAVLSYCADRGDKGACFALSFPPPRTQSDR